MFFFKGDDGEEFKVKKSSYSKKIKKQMNKEKMGRDKLENGKKSKILSDAIKPIKEKQTNFNVNLPIILTICKYNNYLIQYDFSVRTCGKRNNAYWPCC